MPDVMFTNPKLAKMYDYFDGERNDLPHYLEIVKELKPKSIVDIGCGTGSFTTLLSKEGYSVVGIDPAQASLDVAQSKLFADKVEWITGETAVLNSNSFDLAVMTGNVAQVFLTDESWKIELENIRRVLNPGGYFVFESRNPTQKDWKNWTKEKTFKKVKIPKLGTVEAFCEVTDLLKNLVSFCWTYYFSQDGTQLKSHSTIRFWDKIELINFLEGSGFDILDIRDAPDRPEKEFVFLCRSALR